MALIGADELERNLLIDGQPYAVLEVFFASPTARKATMRTQLRQLLTGAVMEKASFFERVV